MSIFHASKHDFYFFNNNINNVNNNYNKNKYKTSQTKNIILQILKAGILSSILSLALTLLIDSYFWQSWVWPEGYVLWYNTYMNKSSNWGTLPYGWYFYSAIPRCLLSSLFFVLSPMIYRLNALKLFKNRNSTNSNSNNYNNSNFNHYNSKNNCNNYIYFNKHSKFYGGHHSNVYHDSIDQSKSSYKSSKNEVKIASKLIEIFFIPSILYLAIYSLLPHKELRFVFYVVPLLNVLAAHGCHSLWNWGFHASNQKGRSNNFNNHNNRHRHPAYSFYFTSLFKSTTVLVHLNVNVILTLIFLEASRNNYPGAKALMRLQVSRQIDIYQNHTVYMDTYACQNGISKFSQLYHHWKYVKTENISDLQISSFEYLIMQNEPTLLAKFIQTRQINPENEPNLTKNDMQHFKVLFTVDGVNLQPGFALIISKVLEIIMKLLEHMTKSPTLSWPSSHEFRHEIAMLKNFILPLQPKIVVLANTALVK